MKKIILLISINIMIFNTALAENNNILILQKLQGYKIMTGIEISEILLGKTVILKDLLSEAVYEIKINKNGVTEKKTLKTKSPKTLTNVDYQARADLLKGALKFTIEGNKIITTDGLRTYVSTLYKKDNNIYGVRDVDHESVNFQILTDYNKAH